MVECFIESVRVSLTNQDRIVVLKDQQSTRYLPIWIGIYESEAITIALQSIAVARPLTPGAPPWQNGELWNGDPSWQNGELSPKNCWKLRGIRGVLTVVLPSTLMLTTEGITFSSIGARLGICWAVVAEEVSAAVAESGDNAKPKLRASALSANVVFFMYFSLD